MQLKLKYNAQQMLRLKKFNVSFSTGVIQYSSFSAGLFMNNGYFTCYLDKKICVCTMMLLVQVVRSHTYYTKLNNNPNYQGLLASARMNGKANEGRASEERLLTVVGVSSNFGIT